MTQASRFRALLKRDGMVVAPGAYDCITAKLIEQAGFAAVYMTGAGTAATLGYPDFGLVTMSEMVANAGRIAAAVELPVIADADTGYGNELNVFRTVREFEQQRGRRDSHRGPGIPEEMRPSRRQAGHPARGLHRQDPRRGRRPPRRGFHDHRPHRLARRRRLGRGRRPRQCGAGGRGRHGVCRGAADPGRGRGGAAPGQRTMPAQCRTGRQDARSRSAAKPRRWATSWRSCRGC